MVTRGKEGAVSGIAPAILLVAAQSRRNGIMAVGGVIVKADVSMVSFKGRAPDDSVGLHNSNRNKELLI